MIRIVSPVRVPLLLGFLACAAPALAGEARTGGKLLLTGGVTSVEGAAGGGLSSWAVIAGDETEDGIGGRANLTYAPVSDFSLAEGGVAVGVHDRLEFSYQHQVFDTRDAGAALGIGRGFTFKQDVFGAKLRVAGSLLYDQDSLMPQISVGVQYKRADRGALLHALGAKHDSGVDLYASATKLFLAESLLVNATVRLTRANQFGLLGFGGDKGGDAYRAQFEGSAAVMLSRKLVAGAEYRTKPDNLGFAKEEDAVDLFAAWAPVRHLTLTAAYVDLGSIATFDRQRGAFLSVQSSF